MTFASRRAFPAVLMLAAVLLAACSAGQPSAGSSAQGSTPRESPQAAGSGTPRVVTSINVLADMARNVGGDRVSVSSAVPAGTDVHTFQPTPQDIQRIADAELVILNGGGLEAGMEGTIRNNLGAGTRVVELIDRVPEAQRMEGHAHEDEHADQDEHADEKDAERAAPGAEAGRQDQQGPQGTPEVEEAHDEDGEGVNPHAWLDPRLAVHYVEGIRDALVELDPEGRAVYEANAERYLSEIRAVDAELEAQLRAIPAERRKLVTFHDAYPYLARRYGLELIGVVVETPEREPSAAEVAELVTRIREQQVAAVYTEPQVNARILELAAQDAGVKVLSLYSDSLDDRVGSYLELLRFNAAQLAEGLG